MTVLGRVGQNSLISNQLVIGRELERIHPARQIAGVFTSLTVRDIIISTVILGKSGPAVAVDMVRISQLASVAC